MKYYIMGRIEKDVETKSIKEKPKSPSKLFIVHWLRIADQTSPALFTSKLAEEWSTN